MEDDFPEDATKYLIVLTITSLAVVILLMISLKVLYQIVQLHRK